MTMHLVRGFSTVNTREPKFKMTKAKESSWREDFAIYNRELKRQGSPRVSWEEYMDMRLGKRKTTKTQFKSLAQGNLHPRYEDRQHIPSLNSTEGNTTLRPSPQYSGERTLIGIAVMHKSNLVPVFDKEVATEIARMRRG